MRYAHGLLGVAVATMAFAPAPAWSQNSKEAVIRVIGRASMEATPDQVVVRVGVVSKAPTPAAALDQNSGAARRVIDYAKGFGVGEREITEQVGKHVGRRGRRDRVP